jgi:fluoride exporter
MLKWLLIAVGGGLGSVLRYAMQLGIARLWGNAFPLGTLLVNVTGCLLLGVLSAFFSGSPGFRQELRLALTVGALGGFTTFSTFGLESFELLMQRRISAVVWYVAGSVLLGIAAVWLGWRVGQQAG